MQYLKKMDDDVISLKDRKINYIMLYIYKHNLILNNQGEVLNTPHARSVRIKFSFIPHARLVRICLTVTVTLLSFSVFFIDLLLSCQLSEILIEK